MLCWIVYSASSLTQQSADRHVTPLGHIRILIPSRPVFALSLWCSGISGEATKTNFIVFGVNRSVHEPMIYHTWGEHTNHYTTGERGCNYIVCTYIYSNYIFYIVHFCVYYFLWNNDWRYEKFSRNEEKKVLMYLNPDKIECFIFKNAMMMQFYIKKTQHIKRS